MLPSNLQEIALSINPTYGKSGWAPIATSLVLQRAYASRGRGYYKLGGGAIFWSLDVFGPTDNNYPGTCDCSGFVAWALRYDRGRWNTNAIYNDALSGKSRFRLLLPHEQARRGDVIVKAGPDLDGDGARDYPGHVGIVTGVDRSFELGGKPKGFEWWKKLEITHCSGAKQLTIDPATGSVYGAIRSTDASSWKNVGILVRPLHEVYDLKETSLIVSKLSKIPRPSLPFVLGMSVGIAALFAAARMPARFPRVAHYL